MKATQPSDVYRCSARSQLARVEGQINAMSISAPRSLGAVAWHKIMRHAPTCALENGGAHMTELGNTDPHNYGDGKP